MARGFHSLDVSEPPVSEHTEVRAREPKAESTALDGIEAKLAMVRALYAQVPADDPCARLFHVALLRRDEVLLDALLRRFAEPLR